MELVLVNIVAPVLALVTLITFIVLFHRNYKSRHRRLKKQHSKLTPHQGKHRKLEPRVLVVPERTTVEIDDSLDVLQIYVGR